MEPIVRVSSVIGTAGHIDHGKTSLVKALTGIDTDRLIEEKKRGVSIDLGFAYIDFEGASPDIMLRAAVVDVPGHERFIKNMLAGATGIDLVLFVIAADDGVMPQTREHLDILHVLGVKRGIFVITKTDAVAPTRVKEVMSEAAGISKGTVLAGSPVIPVSSVTGEGMGELKKLVREALLAHSKEERAGHFRLPIDRSFPVKGFGTVVTGTVASGTIKKGDDLLIFPSGIKAKVRGIQSLHLSADTASKGQRAAVNLAGVEHDQAGRGDVLISSGLAFFVEKARSRLAWQYECVFEFLGPEDYDFESRKRRPLKVYHFTDESQGILRISRKEGRKAYGRLSLRKPLLMMRGDRFVLRDPSINSTVGGGTVLLNYPAKEMVPRLEAAGEALEGNNAEVIKAVMPPKGLALEKDGVCLMLNTSVEELVPSLDSSGGAGLLVMGGFIADSKGVDKLKDRITQHLKAFHLKNPAEEGLKEDEVIKEGAKGISGGLKRERVPAFAKTVIEALAAANIIKREKGIVSLSAHCPALAGIDGKIQASIMALFSNGISSPLPEDFKKLPYPKPDMDRVFSYLLRQGEIVRLKEGVFISSSAAAEAKAKLSGHVKEKGAIKASEFRDLLGCGRKLAIEILEYFDKERVTLRQGDVRTLRQ